MSKTLISLLAFFIKHCGGRILEDTDQNRELSRKDKNLVYLVNPKNHKGIQKLQKDKIRPLSYHWVIESMIRNSLRRVKDFSF
jgi:hypothetical protein